MTIREVYKSGTTYYGPNGRHSDIFKTLWDLAHGDAVAGDTLHFAGNTEYTASGCINASKSGLTVVADPGAVIKAASPTVPNDYLYQVTGNRVLTKGLGFNGLDNTSMSPMVMIRGDGNVLDSCDLQHVDQYCVAFYGASNFAARNNTIRYAQNGIATGGPMPNYCTKGIIENNTIRDCSQAAIKLRWINDCIVRLNTIYLEYTYWKDFHHSMPAGHCAAGAEGVYIAGGDGPTLNCDIHHNTIIDNSLHAYKISYGFLLLPDDVYWTGSTSVRTGGNSFHDNEITGTAIPFSDAGNGTKHYNNKGITPSDFLTPVDPCADVKAQLLASQAQVTDLNTRIASLTAQNATLETLHQTLLTSIDALSIKVQNAKVYAQNIITDLQ